MEFDKPKVTIDLEEYNELIKKVNEYNSDELVINAKKVVLAFSLSGGDMARSIDYLKREKINLYINNGRNTGREVTYNDVVIEQIK